MGGHPVFAVKLALNNPAARLPDVGRDAMIELIRSLNTVVQAKTTPAIQH